jgi:hypothetical protein
MTTRRYFAQKKIQLEADQVEIITPCFHGVNNQVILTKSTSTAITAGTATLSGLARLTTADANLQVSYGDSRLWAFKTASTSTVLRGFPLQGPFAARFRVELNFNTGASPSANGTVTLQLNVNRRLDPAVATTTPFVQQQALVASGTTTSAERSGHAVFEGVYLPYDEVFFSIYSEITATIDSIVITIQ